MNPSHRMLNTLAFAVLPIFAFAGVASAQQLSLNPTSLLFAASTGSTTAQTQAVTVLSSGSNIFWYAQLPGDRPVWLTDITANGVTSLNPLNVTVNPTGLASGTYVSTVQVYSPYSTNAPTSVTPLSMTVTLIVGGGGTINADKSALVFTATAGGGNPAAQLVQVTTTSTTNILATTSIPFGSGVWLSVFPSSGTLSAGSPLVLTVTATTGALPSSAYAAVLTISSGASTQTVNVTFDVQAGSIISANPNPVYLTAVSGSSTAVTQVVTVTNSSSNSVTVTPSVSSGSGWLSTTGAVTIPGLSTGNITFSAVASGLSLGTAGGQVTLTPSSGNAIQVPVNFTVTATPTLTLNKSSVVFNTSSTQSDTFVMSNSNSSGIAYDITITYQSVTGWLQISPASGTVGAGAYQTVNVTANASLLAGGSYTAAINVTGGGQTQTISVTLSAGAISANPASLTINSAVGGQASGTVTIGTNSATTVSLTNGAFIACAFSSFCATANVSSAYVTPGAPASFLITSSSGLALGTYYATLTFSSPVGTIAVPLTINVGTSPIASITASPSSLSFSSAVGGALQSSQVYLNATTFGTYTASSNQSWLSIGFQGSMSGSVYAPGYMTVYANPAGLSAGAYQGAITIHGGTGGILIIYTTFVVGGGSGTALTVSPSALTLSAAMGGQSNVQTVSVYANTQTYYYVTVQSGLSWLILTQSSGTTPGSITLYANAAGLTTGTYYGYVGVTSSLGSQTVTVTLTVGGGPVSASPSALWFTTPVGSTPNLQSVVISSAGASFTATASTATGGNWLWVSPASASSGATLFVSVTNPGLAVGTYTGRINIASANGNLSVPVTLTVGGAITATPAALQFTSVGGGIPAAQSVSLTTSGSSTDYTISGMPAWMFVTPAAGTITPATPGTLTVYVNPAGLAAGSYNGSIVIAGGGGSAVVQVSFSVGGVTGGGLTAAPGSLTMSAPLGSTSAVQQYVSLSGSLPFSAYATTSTGAGWLSVTPASGTAPTFLYVQANPVVVSTGSYSGAITVYTGQGTLTIPVTFNAGVAPPVSVPAVVGVSPAGGNSPGQQFTLMFSDPDGWQDIGVVNLLVNFWLDGRNSCYLAYSRPANTVYLVNDAGDGYAGSLSLTGSGTLRNSQCIIHGAGSSASGSGNVMTLKLNMFFGSLYAGSKIMYAAARDTAEHNSGWQRVGVWQVPEAPVTTTTAVAGMNFTRGSGTGGLFAFTFTDTKGANDLGVVNILVNDWLDGRHACYLAYSRGDNALYLMDDYGGGLLPGLVLTGTGSLGNNQCTVNAVGSSVAISGNTLTLTLNMRFGSGFAGNRVFYLAARDVSEQNNTGWQAMGSWSVQ